MPIGRERKTVRSETRRRINGASLLTVGLILMIFGRLKELLPASADDLSLLEMAVVAGITLALPIYIVVWLSESFEERLRRLENRHGKN